MSTMLFVLLDDKGVLIMSNRYKKATATERRSVSSRLFSLIIAEVAVSYLFY